MDISNAHVLITGATGGIGEVLASTLAARGARLIVTGRRPDAVQALADRFGGKAIAADLTDPEAPASIIAAAGRVDILIANAGLPASGELTEYTVDEIDRAIDVNLRAPIVLSKLVAEQMVPRHSGHIVFMSSLSGKSASTQTALYNATKFGIRGFALALREDLRPSGIGVSSVFPGPVRDAGMIADSKVAIPKVGTTTAVGVAGATVRAIEKNRAEVTVAPLPLRLATLIGSLAPETAATLSRVTGSNSIMAEISEGQRDKR